MSRRLDGGEQGAEAPASPVPQREKSKALEYHRATLEMKCVLSTVLRRVSMRPARREPERIRMRNIILTPAHRTRVVVERIEPS